ncbi:hypothetical protein CYD26_06720 [Pseudomonas sp. FFUP_PS_473]|uniref:hypothetical protein n=1 Tax=Pseudomonas sp. FFUP_PS_473 TaxID=2060418 RepID=UPI000C798372|nr:hypothetical protein [Pseudomonas sp. FFUP_PS_473]PLP94835.1 hypothetical protein CYD26_06720 [Pseudomonas sp. FFUP_PS_473]
MSKPQILNAIAVEAISELETASTYLDWLDSLAWATRKATVEGHDHHGERLAELSQYLAHEYRSTLAEKAERLNDRFDAHQGNVRVLKVGGAQ